MDEAAKIFLEGLADLRIDVGSPTEDDCDSAGDDCDIFYSL